MIKYDKNTSKIKNSNLLVILESKKDLKKLDFLNLGNPIISNLEKSLKENKSFFKEFFIGTPSFEKLFVFYYQKEDKRLEEYMGESFTKLPSKITLNLDDTKNYILYFDFLNLTKYIYLDYKSKKEENSINILVSSNDILKELKNRQETIDNIYSFRDLVNKPSNDKTPEKFVELAKSIKFKNTKLKILDHKQIKKKGLNLIDAVGEGSKNKPYMLIFERIIDKKYPTYGFVGKGITYDSGGLNLKTGAWLPLMKDDMAGGGAVLYSMKELDRYSDKDLKVNIVACIPLAENMTGEGAYRPGDIIKAYNGKTVEIGNTDAEGRLVLADGMSYISKNYKLDNMITLATLTGACLYALGYNYAGIMGTDRHIIDILLRESKTSEEKYFELPFDNYHIEKTKGTISDLNNISDGVYAGSSMGGAFLYNFCDNGEPYTHIDIAGVASRKESYSYFPIGASGFGVDSLSKLFLSL